MSNIIRVREVLEKLGISKSSLYGMRREGGPYYDATFPLHLYVGKRSIGWIESDIDQWIESQKQQRGNNNV